MVLKISVFIYVLDLCASVVSGCSRASERVYFGAMQQAESCSPATCATHVFPKSIMQLTRADASRRVGQAFERRFDESKLYFVSLALASSKVKLFTE
jgi:hypothetical protein